MLIINYLREDNKMKMLEKDFELKTTLKDVHVLAHEEDHTSCTQGTLKQKIRVEAIKWIKELEKYNTTDWNKPNYTKFPKELEPFIMITGEFIDANYCGNLINWIKHFFNITNEEDLK